MTRDTSHEATIIIVLRNLIPASSTFPADPQPPSGGRGGLTSPTAKIRSLAPPFTALPRFVIGSADLKAACTPNTISHGQEKEIDKLI